MTASRKRELDRIIGDLSTATGLLQRDVPALDQALMVARQAVRALNYLRARDRQAAIQAGKQAESDAGG